MTRTRLKAVWGFSGMISSFISGVLLLAGVGLLVSGLGCAPPEAYRVSQQMIQEENYDQAVVELRKLVFEDPGSSQYQLLLGEAESKAADQHVSRAKKMLAEHRPRDAQEELRIALDQVPAHPEAVVMVSQVTQKIEKATLLAERAQAALAKSAYKEAFQLADAALAIDQTLRATKQVRNKALVSAIGVHNNLARQAMEARQWDACLAETAKIRQLDRNHTSAGLIEEQVAKRRQALNLLESASDPIRKKDHTAALVPLRKAASLWPENQDISGQRDHITRVAVEQFIHQAEVKLKAKQFAEAIEAFDQALLVSPNDQTLIQRRRDAANAWSAHLLDQYERRALAGEWEHAWREAIQAAVLRPAMSERVKLDLVRAEGKIREEIAYNMSVLPLPSATVTADGVKAICDALIETLGKNKPDHVQLMERTNLGKILAQHDLSLANISESSKLADLGRKLPGIDVFLFVDASAQESQGRQNLKTGTSKYLAGQENVQNPDYAKAQKDLEQNKQTLDNTRSRALLNEMMWDAAGRKDLRDEQRFLRRALTGYYGLKAQQAAEDYNVALMKLRDMPSRILRNRWEKHQYPIYRAQREVSVKVRLRLIEVATGRILWSDNESVGKVSDSDTLIEPDDVHNVPSKMAILKSASELMAEAVDHVIPTLRIKAKELLSRRSSIYLQGAQKNVGEIAVENYVRFLFDSGPAPTARDIKLALDEVFRSYVAGSALNECKRLANERLNISTKVSTNKTGKQPIVSTAAPVAKANVRVAVASPAESTNDVAAPVAQPKGPGNRLSALVRRARPSDQVPKATMSKTNAPPPVRRTSDALKQEQTATAKAGRVIKAAISRDDDRYPKQMQLGDGITVKLADTDADPLDADLEIEAASHRRKYKDVRVGATIAIRGSADGRYELIILAIDDHTETVWFALDRMQR